MSDLVAEPAEGRAPLVVGFSWSAADVEGDTLSCTVVYGSERQQVENCGEVTDAFHAFSVAVRMLEPEIR